MLAVLGMRTGEFGVLASSWVHKDLSSKVTGMSLKLLLDIPELLATFRQTVIRYTLLSQHISVLCNLRAFSSPGRRTPNGQPTTPTAMRSCSMSRTLRNDSI